MKSNPLDRIFSLSLTTALHAAAGLALLLMPPPGGAQHGDAATQGRSSVLVVKLIPLEQGSATGSALRPEPRDTLTDLHPAKAAASNATSPADAASDVKGTDKPANLGNAPTAAQVGSSATSLIGASAVTYRDLLLAHIARFRQYPEDERRSGLKGSVEVGFTLHRNGSIDRAWVVSSSGRTVLDREALAAIHRAVPMPPIPSDLPSSLDVSLPIDFEIE